MRITETVKEIIEPYRFEIGVNDGLTFYPNMKALQEHHSHKNPPTF